MKNTTNQLPLAFFEIESASLAQQITPSKKKKCTCKDCKNCPSKARMDNLKNANKN